MYAFRGLFLEYQGFQPHDEAPDHVDESGRYLTVHAYYQALWALLTDGAGPFRFLGKTQGAVQRG
jgi:hypothetical protein